MEWFVKLVRIAGVNFPVAASFVQLQAEIDSDKIEERLESLARMYEAKKVQKPKKEPDTEDTDKEEK